jgi:hypothetical protein
LKGSGIVAEERSQDHLPKAEDIIRVSCHVIWCYPRATAPRESEREGTYAESYKTVLESDARFYNRCGHGIRLQFGQPRRRNTPQKIVGGLYLFFVVDHVLVEAEGVSDGCHATSWASDQSTFAHGNIAQSSLLGEASV